MPREFSALNYYEMLDVRPEAVEFEIRHAYNAALQVYQSGSLASYSFFQEDERHEILALLEKAYQTLINDQARKVYDEELISKGELKERKASHPSTKIPVSIFSVSRQPAARIVSTNNEILKNKIKQSPVIAEILAQHELCGGDLKKMRTELDVPIEQVSQVTKIRHDHLRNIEEDRVELLPTAIFLKGFVKAYLKHLCLEPEDELATRYMQTVTGGSRS
jgi:hypothetical protein